jgi:hypothetical protein
VAGVAVVAVVGVVAVARARLLVPVLVLGLVAGFGWLAWQVVTRWTTATVAIALALLGVLLAAVAVRRWRGYRRTAGAMWPAVTAALILVADIGWLAYRAVPVVFLVAVVPAAILVAVAARYAIPHLVRGRSYLD